MHNKAKVSRVTAVILLAATFLVSCGGEIPEESTFPAFNQSDLSGMEGIKSDIDKSEVFGLYEDSGEESQAPAKTSTPDDFIALIKEGRYNDAIKMYSDEFYGNALAELKCAELFEKFVKEISKNTFAGSCDTSTATALMKTALNVADNISELYYSELSNDVEIFENAVASKTAFLSGTELFDVGEWGGAIEQLSKVDERDSNSNAAKTKINEAIDAAVNEAFGEAEEYLNSDDYISAIARLNECKNIVGENSRIDSKIMVYTQKYISNTVKAADKAFGSSLNYEAAISAIREAIQYYPDDKTLNDKLDYYNKFVPVELFTLKPYQSEYGFASYKSREDTFGVRHENVIMSVYHSPSAVYDIGGDYNVFTCSIVGDCNSSKDYKCSLEIYGDGKLIYRNTDISSVSRSFDISIDITGMKDLEFRIDGAFMLYNGYVKRTKK